MIKYCLEQWNKNKDNLEKLFFKKGWSQCTYNDLVRVIITEILNPNSSYEWDADKTAVINNGDWEGVLLFLIPRKNCNPTERDYLTTFVDYGSCSGCDTLLRIQEDSLSLLSYKQVTEYMQLCKDILMNMRIFNNEGWRHREEFDLVEFNEDTSKDDDKEDWF